MAAKPDPVRKKFSPLLDKNLSQALAHRIGKEFPRIGGPRIRALCAQMILEVVGDHLRPREHLTHGQVLWLGISVEDPPARGKRTADTHLLPLILDLSTDEDVQARLDRCKPTDILLQKAIRLCRQAYQQKALLSNPDLAELLRCSAEHISSLLSSYEKRSGEIIPRRATVHDVGSGLTHKAIICRKRYIEGKSPPEIARETYHTLQSVDRYLGQYDRVRYCLLEGMQPQQIAYTLGCSLSLVSEYVALDKELSKC